MTMPGRPPTVTSWGCVGLNSGRLVSQAYRSSGQARGGSELVVPATVVEAMLEIDASWSPRCRSMLAWLSACTTHPSARVRLIGNSNFEDVKVSGPGDPVGC